MRSDPQETNSTIARRIRRREVAAKSPRSKASAIAVRRTAARTLAGLVPASAARTSGATSSTDDCETLLSLPAAHALDATVYGSALGGTLRLARPAANSFSQNSVAAAVRAVGHLVYAQKQP